MMVAGGSRWGVWQRRMTCCFAEMVPLTTSCDASSGAEPLCAFPALLPLPACPCFDRPPPLPPYSSPLCQSAAAQAHGSTTTINTMMLASTSSSAMTTNMAAAADYPSPRESRFGRLVSKLNSGLSPSPSPSPSHATQSRSPSPAAAAAATYNNEQQDMHSDDNPSTPVRYVAAGSSLSRAAGAGAGAIANSPALSDIDDIPVRPPVFESRFMRELELHNTAAAGTDGTTVAST